MIETPPFGLIVSITATKSMETIPGEWLSPCVGRPPASGRVGQAVVADRPKPPAIAARWVSFWWPRWVSLRWPQTRVRIEDTHEPVCGLVTLSVRTGEDQCFTSANRNSIDPCKREPGSPRKRTIALKENDQMRGILHTARDGSASGVILGAAHRAHEVILLDAGVATGSREFLQGRRGILRQACRRWPPKAITSSSSCRPTEPWWSYGLALDCSFERSRCTPDSRAVARKRSSAHRLRHKRGPRSRASRGWLIDGLWESKRPGGQAARARTLYRRDSASWPCRGRARPGTWPNQW